MTTPEEDVAIELNEIAEMLRKLGFLLECYAEGICECSPDFREGFERKMKENDT